MIARLTIRLRSASRAAELFVAVAILLGHTGPAFAIDIILQNTHDFDGEEDPAWDEGGAALMAHAEAAAQMWESLFPSSSNTYELWIEWDNDIGGSLGKWTPTADPTWNLIEINSDRTWFSDPTPSDHSEFDFATPSILSPTTQGTTLYRDLKSQQQSDWFPGTPPPGVLEVGFRGAAITPEAQGGFDLLSTLIHEMGHELGISWIEPGEYNIHPQHIGNLADVLVAEDPDPFSGHLAGDGDAPWLMCENCGIAGVRRLPSATDILVIAEEQGIDDVQLHRADFIGLTWEHPLSWVGGRVPDQTVTAFVRDGPANCGVGLSASDAIAASVHISRGCLFYTHDRTLAAFNAPSTITTFPGEPLAKLIVSGDGLAVLGDLALDGGRLELSTGGVAVVSGVLTVNRNEGIVGEIFNNSGSGKVDVKSGLVNNGLIRSQLGKLSFRRTDPDPPVFDLDGKPDEFGVEPGEIDAIHGDIFFDATFSDDFDGLMTIGIAHKVTFGENWILGQAGRLTLRGTSVSPAKTDGASTSTIRGQIDVTGLGQLATKATVLESTAQVSIDGANDRLELTGLTTFRGGSYTGRGTLAQIGVALIDRPTTIGVDTFDWDGDEAAPSTTSILPSGALLIQSIRINPTANDYHGQLHSLGAIVNVALRNDDSHDPPPAWVLATDGALHLKNETSQQQGNVPPGRGATLLGVPVEVQGSIFALGQANRIDANVVFRHSARVQLLTADSELLLNRPTEYWSGSYFGPGTIVQNGNASVHPNLIGQFPDYTIIDAATYDWDGGVAFSSSSTYVAPGATFMIRSQQIDEPGDGYDGSLTIDEGVMMVRLSGPTTSWRLNSGGAIGMQNGAVLSAASDVANPRVVGGTSLAVDGRLTATGAAANDVYTSLAFESHARVSVENGAMLNLRGSRTSYRGGSYTGSGALRQWTRATVDAPTSVSVATFDLDGGNEDTLWELNADLTLDVSQIDTGGNVFHGTIDANQSATFAVNLPAPATWEIAGALSVGSMVPTTTLDVTGSPVKLTGDISVKGSGKLVFHNSVSGAASFTGGGTVQFLDSYGPGNSPAIVHFDNDVEFGPDAVLKMEMRGTTPGSHHDQIVITQDVHFDGTLDIDLLGPFAPQLGQQFVLATYVRYNGAFVATEFPQLSAPGTYWAIDYGSTALTATIAKTIAGDVSLDGVVNEKDAALFASFFGMGSGSTWSTGDFDGDGATTLADLALLQSNFGQSAPSSPTRSSSAVPEPTTAILAILGIAVMGIYRTAANRACLKAATPIPSQG